jgi:hypothetical protein
MPNRDEATGRAYPPERVAPTLRLHLLTTLGFALPYTLYAATAVWFAPLAYWSAMAAAALAPALPRTFYRLLKGAPSALVSRAAVWDGVRADYRVTYARPGEPGAFAADPAHRYVFCYHPVGVQARGAWYTFALKGRASPVAALADCKLAVSRMLWATPLGQQIAVLSGACDASWRTLTELLAEKVRRVGVGGEGFAAPPSLR